MVCFGGAAMITALLGIAMTVNKKDSRWMSYVSLSLTALTLCSLTGLIESWVERSDWSALMDVVPGMGSALLILTAASILINGVSFIKRKDR